MSINDRKTQMRLNNNIEPTIEVINTEPSVTVLKKLSVQLIEEIEYDSSDESDGENFEPSVTDIQKLSDQLMEEMEYESSDQSDGGNFEPSVTVMNDKNGEINKTYLDNNDNSDTPVLDVNEPNIRRSKRTRKNINYFENHREIPKIKKLSMKWKEKKRIKGAYVQRKKKCIKSK